MFLTLSHLSLQKDSFLKDVLKTSRFYLVFCREKNFGSEENIPYKWVSVIRRVEEVGGEEHLL